MTTTYDLIPEGKVGRSISVYKWSLWNPRQSYARKIDFIDSGLDTQRDCVWYARSGVSGVWDGDGTMPLQTVTLVRTGGGQGYRVSEYGPNTFGRSTAISTLRAEYEPGSISLEWWETYPGSGVVNTEYDETTDTSPIVSWSRKIEVINIYVPTLLNANPIGSVDGMINKVNSSNFEIDGVTYAAKTLLFLAPDCTLAKMPNGSTQRQVMYHYVARADTWRRQYLASASTVGYRDMFESTSFTNPPYNG